MKKIIVSASLIAAVAAMVVGATTAFFNDTETSTGNVFAAGAIDLKVDNESYITDNNGRLVASTSTSWSTPVDLTIEKFFNFSDVKPGDVGEDTISLHVDSNPAWVCADTTLTIDRDNSCNNPEIADDETCSDPDGDGELDNDLNFVFWNDDGDNVLETGESIIKEGGAQEVLNASWAIADSANQGQPLPGATVVYVGKAWCFGTLTQTPITQDGQGKTGNNGPLNRGTGISCDGAPVNNAAQTDSLSADISFRAVQSRNNASFLCNPPQEEENIQ